MSDDSQHPRINQITEFATRPDDATVEGMRHGLPRSRTRSGWRCCTKWKIGLPKTTAPA